MSDLNPKISVIIPVYNGEETISYCIKAVQNSSFTNHEIIVVDDGSTDNTVEKIRKFLSVKLLLQNHYGPAAARNYGAKQAKGEILFFLDADVILESDALLVCNDAFTDPKIKILNGIYHKIPSNPSFITEYKALFEYYWFTVYKERQIYKSFMGRCAGINKNVFEETGGYNTKYVSASVEQEELGFRLSQHYKIYLEPRMQGKHYFPSWKKLITTYFTRTIDWIELFNTKREFDSLMTTSSMSIATIAGPCAVVLTLLILYYPSIFFVSILFWILFFYGYGKIFIYMKKEKGLLFCVKGILTALMLSFVLTLAAFSGMVSITKEKFNGIRD
ncbi:glycosyltransferase family 2 protein [Candidatus Poribacteria bacterium]|nr:glycosyltransferase family 2 protein [Candidatus Poribacteria bacterium]